MAEGRNNGYRLKCSSHLQAAERPGPGSQPAPGDAGKAVTHKYPSTGAVVIKGQMEPAGAGWMEVIKGHRNWRAMAKG